MKQIKFVILVPLILTFIAFFLFIPIKQALVFEYQNTGKVLAYIPFSEEDSFKIKYTHSIHLSDVVESFKLNNNGHIHLYELVYEDFAIGMPENASDGEVFEQKDGKYYIKNIKQVFPQIDMRIGEVRANHTIVFQNKEYPLTRFIEPGTWVRIKIEKLNVFEQMKGVNLVE